MKQRKPLLEKLDLMEEPKPRQSLVEMFANRRVIVENHRGVMDYCKDHIRVRAIGGSICIQGEGLLIRKMCNQQLVITGNIASIQWDRGN